MPTERERERERERQKRAPKERERESRHQKRTEHKNRDQHVLFLKQNVGPPIGSHGRRRIDENRPVYPL